MYSEFPIEVRSLKVVVSIPKVLDEKISKAVPLKGCSYLRIRQGMSFSTRACETPLNHRNYSSPKNSLMHVYDVYTYVFIAPCTVQRVYLIVYG